MNQKQIRAAVEAMLFASGDPIPLSRLAAASDIPERELPQLLNDLNTAYQKSGHALQVLLPEKTAQLKDMGKVGLMAHDLFQRYRKRSFGTGLKMYDACAVACLLEPDLFDMTKAFVDVEIAGELTAGCTVVDLKGYLKREPNATVTTGVHADRFCDWFMDGIAHCA